jgi:hypothetical protein
VERKILLFAKFMSLLFAGIALIFLIDTLLTPQAQIQYVMAHQNKSGYRSTSKYGAAFFRENYLHCIPFRSTMPYRLRKNNEIDTNLLYPSVAERWSQANSQRAEFTVLQVPVDLSTYYDLEDGDSIRLFLSPVRGKVMGYTHYQWKDWLLMSGKEMSSQVDDLNPDLSQWILTTKIISLVCIALCFITWLSPVFHFSVGMFVFNCVASAQLYWFC